MTPYGERRRAGDYDPDGTAGPTQSTVYADDGGTTTQTSSASLTLTELRDIAKKHDVPYYGTKAELVQRLAEAGL